MPEPPPVTTASFPANESTAPAPPIVDHRLSARTALAVGGGERAGPRPGGRGGESAKAAGPRQAGAIQARDGGSPVDARGPEYTTRVERAEWQEDGQAVSMISAAASTNRPKNSRSPRRSRCCPNP